MNLKQKDIIWAYLAQFFQIAAGIIILPLILRMLNTNEIAINYLMLNIGTLVTLFDFGFSGQFSRNFSYIFSGAQNLKKDGVILVSQNSDINFRLLRVTIYTAQMIYRILSLFVLIVMLTLGTWYIHKTTDGFKLVPNIFTIWVIYSISVFFNFYYMYFNPLLIGKGDIAESRKAIVYSRFVYLGIACILLFLKYGLISIVLANLIAPFVQRFLSIKYIYKKELKEELKKYTVSKKEFIECYNIIWYNAKKMGLVMVASFMINKSSIFLSGLFFTPDDVASYGLMLQLVGVLASISATLYTIHLPRFASLRVSDSKGKILKNLLLVMGAFYFLFIFGSICLIMFGNHFLNVINSNSLLPNKMILILYTAIVLLEYNHSCFAGIIATNNTIPYARSAFIAGLCIIIGNYVALRFFHLGIVGLILVQGIVQLCYANWKWPLAACRELNITINEFIVRSFFECVKFLNRGIKIIKWN
jgi:O-antigen/teichoic acid export membrane protein